METKICNTCKVEKTLNHFTKIKGTNRYRCKCHECRRLEYHLDKTKPLENSKEYYQKHRKEILKKAKIRSLNNKEKEMWKSAKERARKKGVPFDIEIKDIVIPEFCPVLGIPIIIGEGKPIANSPSLDRIIPEKGYVKGNIVVVSQKANTIKNDATVAELRKVLLFYEKLILNREVD